MKLMLIDGNSIINRAFFGIRELTNSAGLHTNGVYGFMTILKKLLDEEEPDSVCVAFDLSAPTFRHRRYDGYKANRKGMPDELAEQMAPLKEALDAMGIRRAELEGYEADDIIGTLSARCEAEGGECVIVTGDRDSFQLISGTTSVLHVRSRMGQTESIRYDKETFAAEYGFEAPHIIDLKALMGDSSDNIPGVRGVGEKTAMDLIQRYTTLAGVYEHISELKPAVANKLGAGRESAELSYELATIDRSVPLALTASDCAFGGIAKAPLFEVFKKLEFFKLIDKWELRSEQSEAPAVRSEVAFEVASGDTDALAARWRAADFVCVTALDGLDGVAAGCGGTVTLLLRDGLGAEYDGALRALFAPDVKKITHDLKRLAHLLLAEGLPCEGFIFDTMLAAYLLSPTDSDYAVAQLALRAGIELPPESVYASEGALSPLGDRSVALTAWAEHTAALGELYALLAPQLRDHGMTELLERIELPLAPVLAEMEDCGFLVDRKALGAFGEMLAARISELEESIYSHAGERFNINSTKQLGEVLFGKLMLPYSKKTKTGYSTNIDVLEKLRGKHPIIGDIIEYRAVSKLKSTYVDGLLKVIAPDGRIHTNFTMTVTATGRLSSTEPNLQNIPVRTELGREMRRVFVAPAGHVLVDADYSQIELRLLAHISGDERMKQAFISGGDIHRQTASQVFGIAPEEVTSVMRSRAKAVNFGIVYGISAFSLSEDIGVPVSEAKAYMDSYLEKYSGVREYMKDIVERAKRDGFVSTIMGRRREIPDLASSNFNRRAFGERVALNTPIQGSAADIIKLAMINVAARLKAEGLAAKLIMQVHDELIVEAPEAEAERVSALLTEEMERVVSLSVPLTAEAKSAATWFDAK